MIIMASTLADAINNIRHVRPDELIQEKIVSTENRKNEIRSVFLQYWYEYAVFNTRDIDSNQVIAQGQQSGKMYILTLDDDFRAIDAELY